MPSYELVVPTDDRPAEGRRLAPRPASLTGLRLGLLDNRKGNANVLLERLAQRLAAEQGLGQVVREEKHIFSRPAAPDQLDRLALACDVVITAIGD